MLPVEVIAVPLIEPEEVIAPHVIPFVPIFNAPVPVMVVPDIAPPETNDPTLHAEPQVKTLQPIFCPTVRDLAIPTPPAVMIAPVVVDIVSAMDKPLINPDAYIFVAFAVVQFTEPEAVIFPPTFNAL